MGGPAGDGGILERRIMKWNGSLSLIGVKLIGPICGGGTSIIHPLSVPPEFCIALQIATQYSD